MLVHHFGIGEGITNDDVPGSHIWAKHSFNPTSDTTVGDQTWDIWNNPWNGGEVPSDIYTYNPSVSYDLTDYQYGNEVTGCVIVIENNSGSDENDCFLVFYLLDPDNTLQSLKTSGFFNFPNGTWTYSAFYVGVKATGAGTFYEIHKNGTYTLRYRLYDSGLNILETDSSTFDILMVYG